MNAGKAKARRLTTRGAATRRRIVAEAANLAWARGVGEISLDDVMEKSGASKSQLYHYFANKDELLREAAALQAARVLRTQEPLLKSLDSLEAMRRWRDAVLTLNSQSGCPLGALVYQLPRGARRARIVVGEGFEIWRRRIEDGLVTMRDRGELAPHVNPADIALAVLTAVQGGLLLSKSAKSGRPLEVAFDMALAYVAAHLSARAPDGRTPPPGRDRNEKRPRPPVAALRDVTGQTGNDGASEASHARSRPSSGQPSTTAGSL